MGLELKRLAAVCAALVLCRHAQAIEPRVHDEGRLAHELHASVLRAAVAHRGAAVCRQLMVGIAERTWIRGEVIDVQGGALAVRIDDPGRFPYVLKGIPIVPGSVLWAAPAAWTPCI